MKKFLYPLVLAVLLTSCATGENTSSQSAALKENQSQYYGRVTQVVGNEVTLEIGTLAETGAAEVGLSEDETQLDQAEEAVQSDQMPEGRPSGGERPMGQQSGQESEGEVTQQPGQSQQDFQGGREAMGVALTYTGEERQITIPVGVPVSRTMGESKMESDFTLLSTDQIVLVTQQTDGDQSVVVAVEILG